MDRDENPRGVMRRIANGQATSRFLLVAIYVGLFVFVTIGIEGRAIGTLRHEEWATVVASVVLLVVISAARRAGSVIGFSTLALLILGGRGGSTLPSLQPVWMLVSTALGFLYDRYKVATSFSAVAVISASGLSAGVMPLLASLAAFTVAVVVDGILSRSRALLGATSMALWPYRAAVVWFAATYAAVIAAFGASFRAMDALTGGASFEVEQGGSLCDLPLSIALYESALIALGAAPGDLKPLNPTARLAIVSEALLGLLLLGLFLNALLKSTGLLGLDKPPGHKRQERKGA